MWHLRKITLAAGAVAVMASAAQAQVWSDDMESYPLGQLDGQDRWKGWDSNNTLFSDVVNTQANGGAQSAEVKVGADTICDYDLLPPACPDLTRWHCPCAGVSLPVGFFPGGTAARFRLVNDD